MRLIYVTEFLERKTGNEAHEAVLNLDAVICVRRKSDRLAEVHLQGGQSLCVQGTVRDVERLLKQTDTNEPA